MDQFLLKFQQYLSNAFTDNLELFLGIGSLILLYILILILLSLSKEKTSTYNIFKSVYISSFIVLTLLLIVAISIWNFSELFEFRPIQFIFFLTEIVLLIIPLVILISLTNHFTRDKLHKISGVSYSERERDNFYHEARRAFRKMKYFFLLPLLPFLLLLIQNPHPSLLSIVIDNSNSMGDFNAVKRAVASPLGRVDEKTIVTLGHFEICSTQEEHDRLEAKYKSDVKEIVNKNYFNDLTGVVEYFSNKNDAIEYLNWEGFELNNSSTPLYECVWKNYLYVKDELPPGQQYKKKILIVATDGIGNLTSSAYPGSPGNNFNIFMYAANNGQTISDFYDDVSLISFGDGTDPFFYSLTSSNIYDGQNPSSIEQAMKNITSRVSIDWMFIILLVIPLGLVILILLFIVPKKL